MLTLYKYLAGLAVPIYDYVGERSIHFDWAATKGEEGLRKYIDEKNLISLDGLPTDIGLQRAK